MSAAIITFPLAARGGELLVTEIRPGEWIVDHWVRRTESVCMVASGFTSEDEAVWSAISWSLRLNVRLALSPAQKRIGTKLLCSARLLGEAIDEGSEP